MLLLRDFAFFLFSASVGPAPRSRVALSLSTALVDLRTRRVVGRVVSPAMTVLTSSRSQRNVEQLFRVHKFITALSSVLVVASE